MAQTPADAPLHEVHNTPVVRALVNAEVNPVTVIQLRHNLVARFMLEGVATACFPSDPLVAEGYGIGREGLCFEVTQFHIDHGLSLIHI